METIKGRHYDPPTAADEQAAEWALCAESPIYFLAAYGWVFNATEEAWIPFDVWPAQAWALLQLTLHRLVIILKARQLGFTWLILGYALWQMLFRSAATIGIFSRTETDAGDLLDFRLKGMYERLPAFLRCRAVLASNMSRWELSNGSVAMAFATTGGRQYTFSFLMADEADFQENLPSFMRATKPAIDAGGSMVLLSTSEKTKPSSLFKQIYRAAKLKQNEWLALFLPWYARPGRTVAWYNAQKRDSLANTGSLDDVHQEYPATDTESLAPRSLDKRIPMLWVERCYQELKPLPLPAAAPPIEALQVFSEPLRGREYIVGCDTAEGNPTSDDSAIAVVDKETGDEVAALAGKFQPNVTAAYCKDLSAYYNHAAVLVERNNHGHAVILWLQDNFNKRLLINGHDGRPGWNDNSLGKTMLYSTLAESFRTEEIMVHSFETYLQIVSIEGSSLRAPEGLHDDRADAFALANIGREFAGVTGRKTAKVMQRGAQ